MMQQVGQIKSLGKPGGDCQRRGLEYDEETIIWEGIFG